MRSKNTQQQTTMNNENQNIEYKRIWQDDNATTSHPYNLTSSDGTSGTSGTTYDTLIKEILNFCSEDWHTIEQIAETVQRSKRHIRGRIIPLIKERLEMKYPNNPNHPNQQYRTKR